MQAVGVPKIYSARTASAVAGVRVVAALYPALLVLFNGVLSPERRTMAALFGTAVAATHFSGLLYSRGGGQMAGATLATILTALGLYLTFHRRSWKWAILTGVALGLAQTTYEAALGLPVLLAAYTGVRLVWPGDASRKEILGLAGLVLLTGLVSFSPFIAFYLAHPGIYLAHVADAQDVVLRRIPSPWRPTRRSTFTIFALACTVQPTKCGSESWPRV